MSHKLLGLVPEPGSAQQRDPVSNSRLDGDTTIDEKRLERGDNQMLRMATKPREKILLMTTREFNTDWKVDEIKELLIILSVLMILT